MPMLDIEVGLSEEEIAIRDTVHKFAAEVMRPVGQQLDKLADPADVIAEGSPLYEVIDQYRAMGLGYGAAAGTEDMTPIQKARVSFLINEELGWGDGGLAISLSVADFHKLFVAATGNQELIEKYTSEGAKHIGCWAITEPSHGSDMLKNDPKDYRPPARKPDCIATADGDDWIINGQKAAWVSNGTIADVGILFCSQEEGGELKGGGICVCPFDLKGVTKGKPLDKLGQRALNQGEIFFDNVRIPKAYMFVGPQVYGPLVEAVLAGANMHMGTIFVGLARAAFELAHDYTKERIQGGVPIIEHQAVQARLFKMFMKTEAARSLVRRVMLFNSQGQAQLQYSIAAKVYGTNTAFEVASEAVQMFGGNGLTKEYPIEKMLRDARASMIEDGCNELLGILAATKI